MDDQELENKVRTIIIEICTVLLNHGYKKVPMGPIMRLMGVENEKAVGFDNDWVSLDEEFLSVFANKIDQAPPPPGTIIH